MGIFYIFISFLSASSISLKQNFKVRDYPRAKILAEKHIVPSMSNGYNVSDIFQTVKDAVGVSPTIACQNDRV